MLDVEINISGQSFLLESDLGSSDIWVVEAGY
jgi:hypothetical protein